MNQEFEDELSSEERRAFDGLRREKIPPSALEERVVQSLRQSGLISPTKNFWTLNTQPIGISIAASLLFFILGAVSMKWLSAPPQKADTPEFMLVLRQTPEQRRHNSAEDELRLAKEYGNWARQLSQQGVLADGEKLKDEGRVLSVAEGHPVPSATPEQNCSSIGGYFLIKAQNYEQAVKVAETCPHLKYGGSIEVREIDRF